MKIVQMALYAVLCGALLLFVFHEAGAGDDGNDRRLESGHIANANPMQSNKAQYERMQARYQASGR